MQDIMKITEKEKSTFERDFIEKLKNAESEIENGQFTEASVVFTKLREKYSNRI